MNNCRVEESVQSWKTKCIVHPRGGTMYCFCPWIIVSWHLRIPRTRFRTCSRTRFRIGFRFQHFPEPRRNLVSVFLVIFCFFPLFFLFFSVFSPVFSSFFPVFFCFSVKNYVSFIVLFPFSCQKLASNSVSFAISHRKLASNPVSFPISRRKLASNRLVFKKLASPTPSPPCPAESTQSALQLQQPGPAKAQQSIQFVDLPAATPATIFWPGHLLERPSCWNQQVPPSSAEAFWQRTLSLILVRALSSSSVPSSSSSLPGPGQIFLARLAPDTIFWPGHQFERPSCWNQPVPPSSAEDFWQTMFSLILVRALSSSSSLRRLSGPFWPGCPT